jgi:hypothetical protein
MAPPIWPTSLPQEALSNGYSEAYPNNLLRSETDAGFGKVRNKGATPPFTFVIPMQFTMAQLTDFLNFYQNVLRNGALRFEHKHYRTGQTVEMRLKPQGEDFFVVQKDGHNWKTTLKIEVLP